VLCISYDARCQAYAKIQEALKDETDISFREQHRITIHSYRCITGKINGCIVSERMAMKGVLALRHMYDYKSIFSRNDAYEQYSDFQPLTGYFTLILLLPEAPRVRYH
jgi:hypothetical protein